MDDFSQRLSEGDFFALFVVVGGVFVVFTIVTAIVMRSFMLVTGPNEALVLSGLQRMGPDGQRVAYRVAYPGTRVVRYPIVERVDRLDLGNMVVPIQLSGAYSKGNQRMSIDGVANVKIDGTEPRIRRAIERFLGQPRSAVQAVARDVLDGVGRSVVAQLTPEEMRDTERFVDAWIHEAEHDFDKLGLCLDTIKIQNVSGGRG